jgi:large subunit ribosomal protein L32e
MADEKKNEVKPKAEVKPKPKAEVKPKPKAEAKPKAKKEAKPKAKKEAKPKKEELEIVEEEEERPKKPVKKIKPELDDETRQAMDIRASRKKPKFRRQEWFRYKRLGDSYRKPRGLHSKMRIGKKYRPPRAKIGYRGPKAARGLHPSGFKEVLVHNELGLEDLDPKRHAVRIAHGVGGRKRNVIQEKADDLGLRVLNRW